MSDKVDKVDTFSFRYVPKEERDPNASDITDVEVITTKSYVKLEDVYKYLKALFDKKQRHKKYIEDPESYNLIGDYKHKTVSKSKVNLPSFLKRKVVAYNNGGKNKTKKIRRNK